MEILKHILLNILQNDQTSNFLECIHQILGWLIWWTKSSKIGWYRLEGIGKATIYEDMELKTLSDINSYVYVTSELNTKYV